MTCETCDLHITYLERIISIQSQEIEYLKTIIANNYCNTFVQQEDAINQCIYDVIDYKINEVDILDKFKSIYPARTELKSILKFILFDNKYKLMSINKKNIKYIDSENFEQSVDIEEFSDSICTYIFDLIKPIIENDTENALDQIFESENIYNNNRVKNLMMLKESKIYLPIMKEILKPFK